MTPFEEADRRLGGMHGYDPLDPAVEQEEVAQKVFAAMKTPASRYDVQRLEAKLDALMVALRAGAIGKWTP